MALTIRTDGSGGSNIITASWFNDYYNLLTGAMPDQVVTLKGNLLLVPFGPDPATPLSGTAVAGSGLGVGNYTYYYTFLTADGESSLSPAAIVATTSGNQQVNLTGIVTGTNPGTTGRNVYRTHANGSAIFLLTTINDNTTTTYTDTKADIGLGYKPTTASTYGGSLIIKDITGTTTMSVLSHDGTLSLNPTPIVMNGSLEGTMTMWQFQKGTYKNVVLYCNGFRNTSGSPQLMVFPTPFTTFVKFYTDGAAPFQFSNNGSTPNATVITALASAGGSISSQSTVFNYSIGACLSPVDTIAFISQTGSAPNTGTIFLEGV